MRHRYLKLATMWMRILLLSISLLAITTFLLWQFKGTWVERFDDFIVNKYQGYHQKRLNHAISTASKSPEEGVVLLDQFLNDLSEIYKLDRLDRVKRTGFETIIKVLNNTDRNEEALVWAERWTEFDDRDLFGQVWRAKLMRKSQSKIKEGWSLSSELYRKIPHSSLIANEYAEYLIERGQFTDAYIAAYKAFENQESLAGTEWQVLWDTGDDFNSGQMKNVSPSVDASDRLSFTVDMPPGVVRLRIDPPMNSRINIIKPMLIDSEEGLDRKFSIIDASLGLSQMVLNGRILVTTGGDDPYFYWDMSGTKMSNEISFVCTTEKTLPVVIDKIFRQANLDVLENALLEKHEFDLAKRFRGIVKKWRKLSISSPYSNAFFEIFWKGSGETFSQEKKVKKPINGSVVEGSYNFNVLFPIFANAEKLRIDFPDLIGKKYTFKNVELVGDGWSYQVDLNKIDDGLSHMVAHQGTTFEVLGSDPHIVFLVPTIGKVIDSIVIRGGVV